MIKRQLFSLLPLLILIGLVFQCLSPMVTASVAPFTPLYQPVEPPGALSSPATFYPDAHVESTSADGRAAFYDAAGESWATVRGHAGTWGLDSDTDHVGGAALVRCDGNNNEFDYIARGQFWFDITDIPDDATITGATFSIYGSGSYEDFAGYATSDFAINVYESTSTSTTSVVTSDYAACDTTGADDTPYSDTSIGMDNWAVAYNSFVLNAAGLAELQANIDAGELVHFITREANFEAADSAPTWEASKQARFGCYYADEAGTDKDPKLVVTYGIAGTPGDYAFSVEVPLTAVDPQPQADSTTYYTDGDGRIISTSANTNYETDTIGSVQSYTTGTQRTIFNFDISAEIGNTVYAATMYLYYYRHDAPTDPIGRTYDVCRVTEYGWTEAGATWNKYDGSNVWGSAGGDFTATDKASATVPASPNWMSWDVTTLAQDAIASRSGQLLTIVKDAAEGGGTNRVGKFNTEEHASNKPYLVIMTDSGSTPSVPDYYKANLNVYESSPTVEEGSWTVNSREMVARIPWVFHTVSAVTAPYVQEIVVRTADLVLGEYLGTGAGNATTIEFADASGVNDMNYWALSDVGVVTNWNHDLMSSRYYVEIASNQTANTDYTYYLYIPADYSDVSSNFSGDDTFLYFEDWDTASGGAYDDEADMQVDYPTWTWINDPTVTVADSVMTITTSSQPDGMYENTHAIVDFTVQARVTTTPELSSDWGMWDIVDGDTFARMRITETDNEFIFNDDGAGVLQVDMAYHSVPFTMEFRHINETFWGEQRDDGDKSKPDAWSYGERLTNGATGEASRHQFYIAENGSKVSVDWILTMPLMDEPPWVEFPDITFPIAGSVFFNDYSENFPYDTLIVDSGDNPQYWCIDYRAQLTRQFGTVKATQITIRVDLNLSTDKTLTAYVGNAAVTQESDNEWINCATVYGDSLNYWTDFDDSTGWETVSGTWVQGDITMPFAANGDVGQVSGKGGRTAQRQHSLIDITGEGDWRYIGINNYWETSGTYWAIPFVTYIAVLEKPGAIAEPGVLAYYPPWKAGVPHGEYICNAIVVDGRTYAVHSNSNIAWSDTPDDPSSWTYNENTGIDNVWLSGKVPGGIEFIISYRLFKYDTTWYMLLSGVAPIGANAGVHLISSEEPPETWVAGNFTYEELLIPYPGYWLEDVEIAWDGADWMIYGTMGDNSEIPAWKNPKDDPATWDDNDFVLQGNVVVSNESPMALIIGGPRLTFDGTDWWLSYYTQSLDDVASPSFKNRWGPNRLVIAKSSGSGLDLTFDSDAGDVREGMFTQTNTTVDAKYKTHHTTFEGNNTEIIVEGMINGSGITYRGWGIITRYDNSTDTGYAAWMAYQEGTPDIRLTRFVGGTYTTLGTFNIPNFPVPQMWPAHINRLRVRSYGAHFQVHYSLWGEDWILAIDIYDGTYSGTGIGLLSNDGAMALDKLRVREYVEIDVIVGTGIGVPTAEDGIRPNPMIWPNPIG